MSQKYSPISFGSKYLRCEANKKVSKCSSNFESKGEKSCKSENDDEPQQNTTNNEFNTFLTFEN